MKKTPGDWIQVNPHRVTEEMKRRIEKDQKRTGLSFAEWARRAYERQLKIGERSK